MVSTNPSTSMKPLCSDHAPPPANPRLRLGHLGFAKLSSASPRRFCSGSLTSNKGRRGLSLTGFALTTPQYFAAEAFAPAVVAR